MDRPTIGILSALPQELEALASEIKNQETTSRGTDQFIRGTLNGVPVVATLSGMGKVNAAIASQRLISEFQAKALIFTGVAGGTNVSMEIGDVIIGSQVFQHDVGFFGDAFVVHPPGVLPEIGIGRQGAVYYDLRTWPSSDFFQTFSQLLIARQGFLLPVTVDNQQHRPKVKVGIIATGDQFIANEPKKAMLAKEFKADAVEMEGGAVAQVASRNGVPCLVIRAISDKAGTQAKLDFKKFFATVAANNALLVTILFQETSLAHSLRNLLLSAH